MNRITLYLLVAAGGALGAIARVMVGDLVSRRAGTNWPYGTLAINLSGCLAIALMVAILSGRHAHPGWRYFLPVGFIGAYTTFSTFGLETQQLIARGAYGAAAAYVCLANLGGLLAIYLGSALGRFVR